MVPQETLDLISNIGYPVAMSLLIYFDLRRKIDKLIEKLEQIVKKTC